MTSYDIQDLGDAAVTQWLGIKNNAWKRWIIKRAEVLKKLKRELRQVHNLSRTEIGYPGICWWSRE